MIIQSSECDQMELIILLQDMSMIERTLYTKEINDKMLKYHSPYFVGGDDYFLELESYNIVPLEHKEVNVKIIFIDIIFFDSNGFRHCLCSKVVIDNFRIKITCT